MIAPNTPNSSPTFRVQGPSRIMALKFPELLGNPIMADLVLSCRDRASFCSSIWSSWAMAPSDLHLVAEVSNSLTLAYFLDPTISQDGVVGAHVGMILSQSRQLANIVKTLPYTTEPIQV